MGTLASVAGTVLAGIAFDPQIRGILAVGVGVVVLLGSSYLLLGTNTGNRLGFLLAATGFFGWMVVMGIVWWVYGIGMLGAAPSWQVLEYNAGDTSQAATSKVHELDLSVLPQGSDGVDFDAITDAFETDVAAFDELEERLEDASNGWRFLPASDPARGEAEATVSANLPEQAGAQFGIDSAADYLVLGAFEVGGKDRLGEDRSMVKRVQNRIEQTVQITHPKHYAVVQVHKVVEQATEPGQAPPTPRIDPDEPVISVIMIRDIGDRRFPSAMITLSSALIFGVLCWMLHNREKTLQANLAAAEKAAKA